MAGVLRPRYRLEPRAPVPFEVALAAWLAAQRHRKELLSVALPLLFALLARLARQYLGD